MVRYLFFKATHIGMGLLYMSTWRLYDTTAAARWVSASIPLAITGKKANMFTLTLSTYTISCLAAPPPAVFVVVFELVGAAVVPSTLGVPCVSFCLTRQARLLYVCTSTWFYAVASAALCACTGQVGVVGLGVLKDEAAVQSMSRTGKKEELLEGPLIYGAVHLVGTLLCWLKSYAPLVTAAYNDSNKNDNDNDNGTDNNNDPDGAGSASRGGAGAALAVRTAVQVMNGTQPDAEALEDGLELSARGFLELSLEAREARIAHIRRGSFNIGALVEGQADDRPALSAFRTDGAQAGCGRHRPFEIFQTDAPIRRQLDT